MMNSIGVRDISVLLLLGGGLLLSLFFNGFEGPLFFVATGLLWLALGVALYHSAGAASRLATPLFVSLALLALGEIASLLWTPVPGYTQAMLWRHLAVPVVFVACVCSGGQTFWLLLRRICFLAGLSLCLLAVWQVVSGAPPNATFLNRNSFAGFLLPLLFWAQFPPQTKVDKGLQTLVLMLGGLVVGLVGSRGALLGLFVAFGFLLAMQWRLKSGCAYSLKYLSLVGIGLVASLASTGLQVSSGLGRMVTLTEPVAAVNSRLLIWSSSLEMFRDAPWYGIGVGVYGLLYPQYRKYADASAGHFAHNDLLQLAIEVGWPGVLLALLVLASLFWSGWRSCRASSGEIRSCETLAVQAGLLALFVHSMLTFNAYVFATLIVAAMLMARLCLDADVAGNPVPSSSDGKTALPVRLVALLVLLPLFLILCGGWSQINSNRALRAYQNGDNAAAIAALEVAQRFWPANDFNWYMQGEVLRAGLTGRNDLTVDDRSFLIDYILGCFEHADKLNPLRPMTPHQRARTLELRDNEAEGGLAVGVESAYREALRRDPKYVPARVDLINFLRRAGRLKQARFVAEEGLRYAYSQTPWALPLYRVGLELRRGHGDNTGAAELEERIARVPWEREQGR